MEFEYATAKISQLDEIVEIYVSAQKFMEQSGNPQWGKGFPDAGAIREGIMGGIILTVMCESQIAAVFSVLNHDENYMEIDGKWLTEGNYLAVHRVAVAEKFRGTGAAKYILEDAVVHIARFRGRSSIRIDTHEKNAPMLGLLRRLNFTCCGTVRLLRDNTQRIAFEKLL